MDYFLVKFKIVASVLLFSLSPIVLFAQTTTNQYCLTSGYTITTINGVLTDEDEAIANRDALRYYFDSTYNSESLVIDYIYNPSHLGGIGDFIKVIYQKFFEKETVRDYDLVEMLDDASSKVKTQKLLLVAHSQGNFYANSFYDVVAGQQGGLPVQAIGVYGVASPASRVAGGGKWLTSDTDHVVVGLVDRVAFFRKIMPPNTHIAEVSGGFDPFSGHSFSDVYLRYRAQQIVSDIRSSLDSLSSDLERREDTVCIDPPKLTFVHNLEGAVLAVADTIIDTTKGALSESYYVLANSIAWVYNTSLAALSSAYSGAVSLLGGTGSSSEKNPASVILATLPPEKSLPTQESASASAPENNKETAIAKPSLVTSAPEVIASKQVPATLSPSIALSVKQTTIAPNTTTPTNAPKLVFVGLSPGFGGGMPAQAAPQVLGTTTETTETANEETTSFNEESDLPLLSLSAPAVTAPQCAFSLATDGCLIATTTVRFEWGAVSGATHYALNNNGVFATTTDTAIDVIAGDFSEYTFGVAAIGPNNESSATSTQTVSMATIPIAINEIAWMGTSASSNDEWFEIKNNTAHTIDLSQWELNAKDGTPHVKLAGSIAPHEYLVFERTDDTVVADVKAHQIYTGALGDSGEQLNLSYASTTLDQTPDSAWIKGEKEGKKTMERYSSRERGDDPNNWGTNLGYVKNGIDADEHKINGTPGSQNSASMLINKGEDITSDFTVTADEERYVVPGFVQVGASSTLTIAPGVKISFLNDNKGHDGYLFVKGSIDAQGTAEDPVIFNSSSGGFAPDIWFGGSAATSTFDQVKFENMGSIGVYKSNLEVRNSEFSNTTGGINAYVDSTVIVENSSFTNESRDALGVYTNSVMSVASSSITDQLGGDGIGAYGESVLTVASTTIKNVKNGDGIGVYDSTLFVSSTTIESINTGDGIGAYDATSTITNIDITNTGRDGIGVYSGTATMTDINVSNSARDGIVLYESISTLSNINVTGSGRDGIDVYDGVINVTDVKVSDSEDVGILVSSSGEPAVITNGEVFNNAVGVSIEGDSAILNDVSVHDNGEGDEDNIVVY